MDLLSLTPLKNQNPTLLDPNSVYPHDDNPSNTYNNHHRSKMIDNSDLLSASWTYSNPQTSYFNSDTINNTSNGERSIEETPLRRFTIDLLKTYKKIKKNHIKHEHRRASHSLNVNLTSLTNVPPDTRYLQPNHFSKVFPSFPPLHNEPDSSSFLLNVDPSFTGKKLPGKYQDNVNFNSVSSFHGHHGIVIPQIPMQTLPQFSNLDVFPAINIPIGINPQPYIDNSNIEMQNNSFFPTLGQLEYGVQQVLPFNGIDSNSLTQQYNLNDQSHVQGQLHNGQYSLMKEGNDEQVYNQGYDDENFDYKLTTREVLKNRYVICDKLGRGSFGQVVSAFDQLNNIEVAVKIIKSKRAFCVQAKTETALLRELNELDSRDEHNIVRVFDTFMHRGHQCIVFERLSFNLYDLLKKTNFQGVSLTLVRKFGRQILSCLEFLSKLRIIHCDLKPENILLKDPKRSAIKIIDFGSSCKLDNRMYTYIQSRFYRAPEVLLGQSYNEKIDMWSLGCVLMEMHTGEPLFSGCDEYEQILRIVCLKGIPEAHLLHCSTKAHKYFVCQQNGHQFTFKIKEEDSEKVNTFDRSLEQALGIESTLSLNGTYSSRFKADFNHLEYNIDKNVNIKTKVFDRRRNDPSHSIEIYSKFVDLIHKMLEYDPDKRIDPTTALLHPFFLNSDEMMKIKQQQLDDGIGSGRLRTGSAPSIKISNHVQPALSGRNINKTKNINKP